MIFLCIPDKYFDHPLTSMPLQCINPCTTTAQEVWQLEVPIFESQSRITSEMLLRCGLAENAAQEHVYPLSQYLHNVQG
jgi:hypothetical protein